MLNTGLIVRALSITVTLANLNYGKKEILSIRNWEISTKLEFNGRNTATRFLLLEQLENGSPVVPGGHVHVALWFVTEHIAEGLQGLFAAHGFMQLLDTQAWNEEHSSSEEQPASTGATA